MSHQAEEESEVAESDGEVSESPTGLAPADAFALLGNDTRIEILQALLEAGADEEPVAFSTLYDHVDIDDSAHFNYHLKQLTDHFVRRTDEGYEFRYPGWKVVRAVFAGTFTDRTSLDPFDAPGTCYDCDAPLQARYGDDLLTIECADCGVVHVCYSFPRVGSTTGRPRSFSSPSTITSGTTTVSRQTASVPSAWAGWRRRFTATTTASPAWTFGSNTPVGAVRTNSSRRSD